jgi:DivIVA domain-containing protein
MELTPDLLLEAKFSAARRGYDMAEVDDFLERCAEGLDVLLARLRAEFDRAERAEAEVAALRAGGEGAVEPAAFAPPVQEEAPEEIEALPVEAVPAPDAPIPVGEPMRILIHAERTAEAAIAEATAEAARIRSEAEAVATTQRSEAETLLERARAEAEAEARRAGDEARAAIQGEVVILRRDRDALTDDIRLLRRWLDEQRGRLRSTARDLQRLADDPTALRDVPVPELSGAPHDEVLPGDETDDVQGSALDEGATSDGEPTQAVPTFSIDQPFDDDDEQDDRPFET